MSDLEIRLKTLISIVKNSTTGPTDSRWPMIFEAVAVLECEPAVYKYEPRDIALNRVCTMLLQTIQNDGIQSESH